MDGGGAIERHSVGGYGTIGSLYDARTDKLEGTNLFNKVLPDTLVHITDSANTDYALDFNNSQKETFNDLNIEASLKLSLLGGLIDISGSAKYLKQTKSDNHTVRVTFLCKVQTKQEHLQVSMAELYQYFSPDALNNLNATHVVTGILWGANVAAIFEQTVKNSDEVTEVEGALSVALKAIPINGEAELKLKNLDQEKMDSLKISFSGDVLTDDYPQTLDGVMKVFKDIPSLIKPLNNGKGRPLVFILYPLKRMAEIFQHELQVERILREVSKSITLRIENIFEDIGTGKRKFNEFLNEMKPYNDYISRDWKNAMDKRQLEHTEVELKTQRELGTLLIKIRSGDATETEMQTLLDQFDSTNICSSVSIDEFLKDNRHIETKIQILKNFKSKENLLAKFSSIEDIILELYEKDVYLLHISNEWFTKNKRDSLKTLRFFKTLMDKEPAADGKPNHKSAFIVIDYDLHGSDLENDEDRADKCCIYYAKNGEIQSKDYLKDDNAMKRDIGEFANDNLSCKGRSCSKCHKCRDWSFNGDQTTWDWICNYKDWDNASRDRWSNDVHKLFTKRDGARCLGNATIFTGTGLTFLGLHYRNPASLYGQLAAASPTAPIDTKVITSFADYAGNDDAGGNPPAFFVCLCECH